MAKHKILLSQGITGFLAGAEARSLRPHTVADYQNAFRIVPCFHRSGLPRRRFELEHSKSLGWFVDCRDDPRRLRRLFLPSSI
jgi:hypothetical protein